MMLGASSAHLWVEDHPDSKLVGGPIDQARGEGDGEVQCSFAAELGPGPELKHGIERMQICESKKLESANMTILRKLRCGSQSNTR